MSVSSAAKAGERENAVTGLETQEQYWAKWNREKAQRPLSEVSARQKRETLARLEKLGRTDLAILEVGCGSAWLTPELQAFGTVTATDLSVDAVNDASARIPGARFIAGDFMQMDLPLAAFDVIVTLEVLAHVADQPAFIAKLARHLRPGGTLILATQNRPVLEEHNVVRPTEGQVRIWVDRHELAGLLQSDFDIEELFSATPQANRGIWHILNARAVNAPLRVFFGDTFDRMKERAWLGWTLMAIARRR